MRPVQLPVVITTVRIQRAQQALDPTAAGQRTAQSWMLSFICSFYLVLVKLCFRRHWGRRLALQQLLVGKLTQSSFFLYIYLLGSYDFVLPG